MRLQELSFSIQLAPAIGMSGMASMMYAISSSNGWFNKTETGSTSSSSRCSMFVDGFAGLLREMGIALLDRLISGEGSDANPLNVR